MTTNDMGKRTNWEDLHTRILYEIVQVLCFHFKKGRKEDRIRMRGYLNGLETIERTMVKMENGIRLKKKFKEIE